MGCIHISGIATCKDGVALATENFHIGCGAIHLVAAAKEVADAEVAAIACGGRVHNAWVKLGRCPVNHNMVLAMALVAAKVVAAKHGHDGAAVDSDERAISAIGGQEGVFGTTEDGVNLDIIV